MKALAERIDFRSMHRGVDRAVHHSINHLHHGAAFALTGSGVAIGAGLHHGWTVCLLLCLLQGVVLMALSWLHDDFWLHPEAPRHRTPIYHGTALYVPYGGLLGYTMAADPVKGFIVGYVQVAIYLAVRWAWKK